MPNALAAELDFRGAQFIAFTEFTSFQRHPAGADGGPQTWTSPETEAGLEWNELVLSWNVPASSEVVLEFEARAIYRDGATKFYSLGRWSAQFREGQGARQSVKHQRDEDGDVHTDTLVLSRPARKFQIRLRCVESAASQSAVGIDSKAARPTAGISALKFLGVSLRDDRHAPEPSAPNRAAWGRLLDVPERSQMIYPGGNVWCSPASVSMVLGFWADRLKQSHLDRTVPDLAREIFDPHWPGTGNWSFNTAMAGSFPELRAYVTRFSDVSELEDWIAAGVPVITSVSYGLLKGKSKGDDGHLVVCVGFTESGDVIVNDPGTRENVRKVFPRQNLISAWATSGRTVYLIYPEKWAPPPNRFHHWASR
ncbi:MAG: peptidase C39 family protein [Verrucomicrobiota bacterium]